MEVFTHPKFEEATIEIRNVNGVDLLFTSDGKLIANQGDGGHIYYVAGNPRYKTFRTSFLVDNRKVKQQGSVTV
jgi:hypothetical protein